MAVNGLNFLIHFLFLSCDQLADTRSADRKQTLLHYIVDYVENHYPELATFYSELELEGAIGGYTVCLALGG